MKKRLIVLFLIVMWCLVGVKTVKAAGVKSCNLIDTNQITYSTEKDVFYSVQPIKLKKEQKYTLVVSRKFLGDVYVSESNTLMNDEFGTVFTNEENSVLDMDVNLIPSLSGLYYSTIIPKEDCNLVITDFLTRGYSIDTLPKTEIILYKGEKEDFQGFRMNEYITDYVKADDVIDLYTSYNNLITIEEITSKIKCYDNNKGFYNDFELIEGDYQNDSQIGVYTLVYKSTDDNNNSATLIVNINVVDNIAPIITGPDMIEWDCYTFAPTPEYLASLYTAYDEVDGNLSNKIKVIRTNLVMYSVGVTRNYEAFIEVTDNSGNKCEKRVVIAAKDVTAPIIKTQDITVNLSELGECVFGDFFGQAILEVSDNSGYYKIIYDANELIDSVGFAGEYELIITVRDAAGNESANKVKFKIIDDIGPEFYFQTHLFNTTTEEVKNVEDIRTIIGDSLHKQGILYDSIDLISCNYFSNETTPGTYEVKYAYSYRGETNYMLGTIVVEEAQTQSYLWVIPIAVMTLMVAIIIIRRRRRIL